RPSAGSAALGHGMLRGPRVSADRRPVDRTTALPRRRGRGHGGSGRRAAGSGHPTRRTPMSELAQRMQQDLTDAMKARDEVRVATLRMAIAAVREEAVAGTQARELSDDDVEKVLRTQV